MLGLSYLLFSLEKSFLASLFLSTSNSCSESVNSIFPFFRTNCLPINVNLPSLDIVTVYTGQSPKQGDLTILINVFSLFFFLQVLSTLFRSKSEHHQIFLIQLIGLTNILFFPQEL